MENFKIIFEDDHILIVNKPTGLVVNRSQTVKGETLQDQLASYLKLGSNLGIGDRAGIVHRLDRETSGLLIVAKTQNAFDYLQNQFATRLVKKEYIGLVHGLFKDDSGSISIEIGRIGKFGKFGKIQSGRESETEFKFVKRFKFINENFKELIAKSNLTKSRIHYLENHARDYALVNFYPKTGRTHQLRVHAKEINHPIVSDLIYCPSKLLKFDIQWCQRLFLHASKIEFAHPKSKKPVCFSIDLPSDLKNAMLNLL